MEHATPADLRAERLLEAERSVLGAVLINNAMLDVAQEHIDERDFFRKVHRTVFEAFLKLSNAGQPIDLVTVRNALTAEELEEIGVAYLSGLIDGVPDSMNVAYYAKAVRAASLKRGLERAARQILQGATDSDEDPEALLESAEQSLFALRDRATTMEVSAPPRRVTATFQQIEEIVASRGAIRGTATRLRDLDADLRGLRPNQLIVAAARPGHGKTALAMTISVGAAKATGKPVLFFSLEMGEDELNLREIAMRARIDGWRLSHGTLRDSDHAAISHALDEMHGGGVHVVDSAGVTVGQIRAISRRAKASMGLSLIVIDYLQLITPDSKSKRSSDTRTLELGEMTRSLKILAKNLRTPILLLSQLSRAPELRSDKRPQLSDLRESGAIEQDADVVLLLYRPAAYPELRDKHPDHFAEINIAKQRNGPTGPVRMAFFKEQTRFADWTDRVEGSV